MGIGGWVWNNKLESKGKLSEYEMHGVGEAALARPHLDEDESFESKSDGEE